MSQKSRVSDASTSPWLQVMGLGVGHSEISTVNCLPLPNKSCFKLTPNISHVSVYFPLGTLASSDDDCKTVTIQRQLPHTLYPRGNKGSQMGIGGAGSRSPGCQEQPRHPLSPRIHPLWCHPHSPPNHPHEDFLAVFSQTVHVYNSFSKQVLFSMTRRGKSPNSSAGSLVASLASSSLQHLG